MNPVQYILILLVRMYQVTLSPVIAFLFGSSAACRFEPTCSRYATEAVKTHGAIRGSWLAAKRVCRCHPWGKCGNDPVPPRESKVQGPRSKIHGAEPKFQGRAKESKVQSPRSKVASAPVFGSLRRGKEVRI